MLEGRKILLIVTGGVAAYKAATLARLFVRAGAKVRTALTDAATHFIAPLTFEALTGERALASLWDRGLPEIAHISWSEWADLLVVAPASADFMAQAASGEAGNFALATLLASPGKALFAPAMNSRMLSNPATQANILRLREQGHRVMSSGTGALACGDTGQGRMPEPGEILFHAARALSPPRLAYKRLLISGGSTLEPWDSIRFMANRSSGLMGVELAHAAWLMGAQAELVLGPMAVEPRIKDMDLQVHRVGSTMDMLDALQTRLKDKDALFMAAAPADFRPKEVVGGKIGKDSARLTLPLARNPDILMELSKGKDKAILVGFAANPAEGLLKGALEKLQRKNLDYIVANPATGESSSFASPDTTFKLIKKGGRVALSGTGSKFSAAWSILVTVLGHKP